MAQLSIAPISAILNTAATTVYTVPAGSEQTLSISMANFSTADITVSLWIVESGGTRGNQHGRLIDYPITAKEPRKVIDRESFPPGTIIVAGASAALSASIQITGTTRVI